MIKLNSKGFSPVHILLLVVIVGMIGGVGYYVYSSQKKTNQTPDNAAKPQPDEKEETPGIYTHQQLKYKVAIPEGWTYKLEDLGSNNSYKVLSVQSPDYKLGSAVGDYEAGGKFVIIATKSNKTLTEILNAINSGETFQKNPAEVTLKSNIKAVKSYCGDLNSSICYDFVSDGVQYQVVYSQPKSSGVGRADKDKYIKEFQIFIDSFTLP